MRDGWPQSNRVGLDLLVMYFLSFLLFHDSTRIIFYKVKIMLRIFGSLVGGVDLGLLGFVWLGGGSLLGGL